MYLAAARAVDGNRNEVNAAGLRIGRTDVIQIIKIIGNAGRESDKLRKVSVIDGQFAHLIAVDER
jgi:hypothetical protein